jgi:hypothetical protein
MAVNVPNAGSYLAQLGQHVVDLREAIDNLIQDGTYLNAMGGAAFLEAAPMSIDATDAQFIATNIGAITPTNATVEAILAFITTVTPLTGGN